MKTVDFLVVALGNPGDEYHITRHNFGFLALDKLAQDLAVAFRHRPLLEVEVGVGEYLSRSIVLAKPLTYMNLSGHAVAALIKFYQIKEPRQLIVIHDDLDIPLGKIKIKSRGGSGGHKGVRSVIESLGRDDFLRIRLGIGLEEPPVDVVDYVLTPFKEDEQVVVQHVIGEASEAVRMVIQEGYERAMNSFHCQRNNR